MAVRGSRRRRRSPRRTGPRSRASRRRRAVSHAERERAHACGKPSDETIDLVVFEGFCLWNRFYRSPINKSKIQRPDGRRTASFRRPA
ncbi:hypothetical protein D8O27_05120 [Burkholderia mallei]|uniref:Uncharacterized protein n=1 Tax=Burkholderia mallei TaxID=13373 RepID=A0AAX1X7R3_BURML|nr:hypothetical protein D8O03_17345 [Burkholderia mallei]RKO00275.1 hypothetical protein D8O05_21020 [Burkholderia mallei]RKO02935.1 hypothetical protein D8O31_01830 [Burkholderia mallei]RKO16829.1 hypothetical protein D8O04_04885 [Burkholderia mallei]RKO20260.1 hypothetical protein D8O30_14545 [Burkholderia mallei]